MKKTETITMRMDPETIAQLDELSKVWKLNKTQCVVRLISSEWLRTTETGKEKIAQIMETFGTYQNTLDALNKQIGELNNGK